MSDDDDLDAFFDEVDAEVEKVKEVKKEDETTKNDNVSFKDSTNDEPAMKKVKLSTTTATGGVVVVSKSAINNIIDTSSNNNQIYNSTSTTTDHSSSFFTNNNMTHNNSSMIQPPLPPGPPPPITNNHNHHHSHTSSRMNTTTIVPMMPQTVDPNTNRKIIKRSAAGKSWEDPSLTQFPQNDYRLFVGNLAKDITDAKLAEVFQSKYPSFAMAKVIFSNQDGKSKGYGFVSLMDPKECAKAIREMDQSWIGSRPIKVKLSEWKERSLSQVRKKKNKQRKKRNNWL